VAATTSEVHRYLKEKVDGRDGFLNCELYTLFNKECRRCPFHNCELDGYVTCGLRTVRSCLEKVADKEVASCIDEPLSGTQKDCLKSLVKRVRNVEGMVAAVNERQNADSLFIFPADHQRIVVVEATIRDLQKQVSDLKENLRKV